MPLLIDGYNLLNASLNASRKQGRTELERARLGLLDFLCRLLELEERKQTTIIFDAVNAPPGLSDSYKHGEILVRFARDHPSADDLIEEIIAESNSPKRLTVVSSDHRIQRAAKRRKAAFFDSQEWLQTQIYLQKYNRSGSSPKKESNKPIGQPSAEEVAYWMKKFAPKE